ncbi:hypothetical protein AOLI_G00057810 [Acnodon oligacanthus]
MQAHPDVCPGVSAGRAVFGGFSVFQRFYSDMSRGAVRTAAAEAFRLSRTVSVRSFLSAVRPALVPERKLCDGLKGSVKSFDLTLLQFLVCPLSKQPLRYDETTNELINEELGIAYPVIDGIPNMIPQDARLIKKTEGTEVPSQP